MSIRILDAVITALYAIDNLAIRLAIAVSHRRNAIVLRQWEALHDDEVPF